MSDVPSEKTQAKAAEYLLSGRIKVQRMGDSTFEAYAYSAKQSGDPYVVRFGITGWHCDCPARVPLCAHVLACQTISDLHIENPNPRPVFERDPDIDKLLDGLL